MSYLRIWVHSVWTTKRRQPFLHDGIRQEVFSHMMENAKNKGIAMDSINGYRDHVHCLFRLGSEETMAKVIQLVKGESSHWINSNGYCQGRFKWQKEYYAASVSESAVPIVGAYIWRQEEHHSKKTFQEECQQLFEDESTS